MEKQSCSMTQLNLDFSAPIKDAPTKDDGVDITVFTTEQLAYLHGPVVHQSRQWSASVPEWLLKSVGKARLRQITEELKDNLPPMATDEELAIVMFGACLDMPINHEHAQIYAHTAQKLAFTYLGRPMDAGLEVLTKYEERLKDDLKYKIRASVVRNEKNKVMGRKRKMTEVTVGPVRHRVILDKPRVPVGGFLDFREAYLFAASNIKLKDDVKDKEAELLKRIQKYQPKKRVFAK